MVSNKKIYYHQYVNNYIYQKALAHDNLLEGIKIHHSTVGGTLDAFENLGYEVIFDHRVTFLFHQKIFFSNKSLSFCRKAYKKIFGKIDAWFLNKRLQKKIWQLQPDYFYTELNPIVSQKTLRFMRSKNIKRIEWFGIFPFGFKKSSVPIQTISHYDIIISPKNFLNHFEKKHRPRNYLEVHAAYNPKVFKKTSETNGYLWDVVFVGGVSKLHSNRWDILEILANRYEKFGFYGIGMKDVPERYSFIKKYMGDVWSHSYAKILNQSKIAINLMLDSFHELPSGVNQRTFEIPACGTFQLSEHTDNLKKFFVLEEDVVTFKNTDEMIEKIDYYLKNDKVRERIALNGHKKSLQYNYYNQMKHVFENI